MLVSGEVLAENWSGFLLDVDAQGFIFRFPCGQGFWLVRTINFKGTYIWECHTQLREGGGGERGDEINQKKE